MRRKAAESLRESEARIRDMAENAPVMIWVTDPEGRCTYLNRQWYEFTGTVREDGLELGWLEPIHPDDRATAKSALVSCNKMHVPFRVEYRPRRRDGTYRWAIDSAAPRFGSDGEFLGYIGSVIDVTDMKGWNWNFGRPTSGKSNFWRC